MGAAPAARIRRGLLRVAGILTLVLLAGATYQGVATAIERRKFPHPGRLVRATDHQMHIHCTGKGSPIVVLEAPATGMSAAWRWVQQDLQQQTRVCSYDRSGLGWSEWGPQPYDASRVPDELHALLQNSGEAPPFIIAGQGLGTAFARLFAAAFPGEVKTLVLVDPPPSPAARDEVSRLVDASPWLARAGVLRATKMLSRRAGGLPETAGSEMRAFLNRPDHLTRAAREVKHWTRAIELADSADLHGVPVITVDAAGTHPLALLGNREQASRVTVAVGEAIASARR